MSGEGDRRLKRLDKALGKEGIEFRPESYKWSIVQVRPVGVGTTLAHLVGAAPGMRSGASEYSAWLEPIPLAGAAVPGRPPAAAAAAAGT